MLIAGNWKMNYGLRELDELYILISKFTIKKKTELCIFPPSPLLVEASKKFKNFSVKIGSQSSFYEDKGAYTGEISPRLLSEIGCQFALAGHSERRIIRGEDDQFVKNTSLSLLKNGITPIICVGETLDVKKNNETINFIKRQILSSVPKLESVNLIVAYEPIWSIGSGLVPNKKEIEDVHTMIKEELSYIADLQVLYGGSVNQQNCSDLFSINNVDGALIGGSSLNFKEFLAIYETAVKKN